MPDYWDRIVTQPHPRAAVDIAVAAAEQHFAAWAGLDLGDPMPEDGTDAMQIELARWQTRNFGCPRDVEITLGVIEELGEAFEADDGEKALDGLGDVMVYAGQLLTSNRLALGPVLALAHRREQRGENGGTHNGIATGKLAHAVLKRAQKIRGFDNDGLWRWSLVDALATIIANAKIECELGHDLYEVDIRKVYEIVGREVLARDWVSSPTTGMSKAETER